MGILPDYFSDNPGLPDYYFDNPGHAGGMPPAWLTGEFGGLQPAPAPEVAHPQQQAEQTQGLPPAQPNIMPPAWFTGEFGSLQPVPVPAAAYPQQQAEQTQSLPLAQPNIGAMAQRSGGSVAREDERERLYAPSALGNLPVPSLPALSLPPLSAIGDRLDAGLLGFAHGGAPLPAVANLISGLVTGQRADPQGVALAQQDRAQGAAAQYVAGAQDIEPNLRAAMLANPALAAQYLMARAMRPANSLAPRLRLR